MRCERVILIKQELEEEHEEATLLKTKSPYKPHPPWGSIFRRALDDKLEGDWWYRHVERPGMMVTCRAVNPEAFVGGDALAAPPTTAKPSTITDIDEHTAAPCVTHRPQKNIKQTVALTNTRWAPGAQGSGGHSDPPMRLDDLSEHDGQKWVKNKSGLKQCEFPGRPMPTYFGWQ